MLSNATFLCLHVKHLYLHDLVQASPVFVNRHIRILPTIWYQGHALYKYRDMFYLLSHPQVADTRASVHSAWWSASIEFKFREILGWFLTDCYSVFSLSFPDFHRFFPCTGHLFSCKRLTGNEMAELTWAGCSFTIWGQFTFTRAGATFRIMVRLWLRLPSIILWTSSRSILLHFRACTRSRFSSSPPQSIFNSFSQHPWW